MARRKVSYDRKRQQTSTRTVTWGSIYRSKPFMAGYHEVLTGKPADYDQFSRTDHAWNYERGRFFGVYAKANDLQDHPLKQGGNNLNYYMLQHFKYALAYEGVCS